jgi:hypothetical protein
MADVHFAFNVPSGSRRFKLTHEIVLSFNQKGVLFCPSGAKEIFCNFLRYKPFAPLVHLFLSIS